MKVLSYKNKKFVKQFEQLCNRDSYPRSIEGAVRKILDDVKRNGNTAIKKYALEFDQTRLSTVNFRVSAEDIYNSSKHIASKSRKAIKTAIDNVMNFAEKRIPRPWSYTPRAGVIVGERFEPLDRIAVYIPGGTAPLVSSVIHTAGLAKAAGVKEIVAFTPPGSSGEVHPAILYAFKKIEVKEVYRLGGVYAIAAAAYGTKTIKKVEKIVGPGNAYVTAAKKLVYGDVAIDMVAGPSEIMVIADVGANPDFIAADMLSQAEHGSGHEQAVLVTTCPQLLKSVPKALMSQSKDLSRQETVKKVLNKGVFLIEVEDLDQAAEVATAYAPEHLEIMCAHAGRVAKKVKAAGAIFLGPWTPEPVGDFVAGPSHVLPTAGTARYFSGLTVENFFRRMSVISYHQSALLDELPDIAKFAEMEGLDAHGRSASIRLE